MEMSVRRVVEAQSCFVALPWHLLELLLTDADPPPSRLVLELRMIANPGGRPWYLAWGGAGASSSQIEVPEALAECIGLADGARVRVRVLSDVSRASKVEIEPANEDDWEVLELNAEYLEEQILNQVGVLHEGQRFPVWVQGQTILILRAVATAPRKMVQLVQGSELVVAPMARRQKKVASTGKGESKGGQEEIVMPSSEAWLRIQDLDHSMFQECQIGSVAGTTSPTTVVFVDPQTARMGGLKNKQLVVVTGTHAGKRLQKMDSGSGKVEGQLHLGELHPQGDETVENSTGSHAIVRICLRPGVARGHVMMSRALRLFIGARVHTRIRVQSVVDSAVTSMPSCLVLSPVQFGASHSDQSSGVGGATGSGRTALLRSLQAPDEDINLALSDLPPGSWSRHKDLLLAAGENVAEEPHHVGVNLEKGAGYGAVTLIKCWLSCQVAAGCPPHEEDAQVPIGSRTIMHFKFGFPSDYRGPEEDKVPDHVVAAKTPSRRHSKDLFFILVSHGSSLSSKNGPTTARPMEEKKGFFLLSQRSPVLDTNSVSKGDSQGETSGKQVQVLLGRPQFASWPSGLDKEENEVSHLSSLTWLEGPASESITRLQVLLSPAFQENRRKFGFPVPGNVLLHGPPACGKSQLAWALAQELKEDPAILAHSAVVRCADLVGEQPQTIKVALQEAISEATLHAPSLIILDGLDAIFPSSESEGAEHGMAAVALGEYLGDLIDVSQRSGTAAIAFLAVARSPTALPASLCCSGRFDFFVELPAPAARERAAILVQSVSARRFVCSPDVAAEVAANCDGCDATDLDVVVDRALHSATARYLSSNMVQLPSSVIAEEGLLEAKTGNNGKILSLREIATAEQAQAHMRKEKFELLQQDFMYALEDFVPAAMRGIAKKAPQGEHTGWDDVGGLLETCHALREMLEMPVKHGKIFAEAPLRLRSGVLLFGPPGCGKTHIVGAAAAACSLRFISVKGPELLNKYIGASEQAVRDLFARAAAAAPCILFFDEFDAIAPRRGHDNTGVTDRVVNQLLTELDGVQALNGVFVFAATSRPDLLDAALLRPGRLDRLLFCDFPFTRERADILRILSRKLPLADDVDLDVLAALTEGFSGADLQAVLSDAQLDSIHSFLESTEDGSLIPAGEKRPCITMAQLKETAVKARPSVTESEKRRLNSIYETFVGNRSISALSRDAKGKRATLA